ncbi:MAG: YhcH/YjgK/YiaL family protein [Planctomycetota bacterium]
MIVDRLSHAHLYRNLDPMLREGLDYLQQTDFTALVDGRYPIDGDRLVAIVQTYRPKPPTEAVFEAHRKFADIQYLVAGRERIGYAHADDRWPVRTEYNDAKDVAFYDAQGDWVSLTAGSFAIFLPHDLHAPGIAVGEPMDADVIKVVMKCLWQAG